MAALMDSGDATMAITSHVVSSVTRTLTLDDAGVVALMEIVGVTSKASATRTRTGWAECWCVCVCVGNMTCTALDRP